MALFWSNLVRTNIFHWGWAFFLLLVGWNQLALAASPCAPILTSSSKETHYDLPFNIFNSKEGFNKFLEKFNSASSFEEQVSLWHECIEIPLFDFYKNMVWNKRDNKDRLETLSKLFKELKDPENGPKLITKINNGFDETEKILRDNFQKLNKLFEGENAIYPKSVYIALTFNFLGKANSKGVVGLGVDRIVNQKRNIGVIISHEFYHIIHFHLYRKSLQSQLQFLQSRLHSLQSKLQFQKSLQEYYAANAAPNSGEFKLLIEGAATFVSGLLNKTASPTEVLNSEDLAKISDEGIYWLASEFLKDIKEPKSYWDYKWFDDYSTPPNGIDLPACCGYLLGRYVMQCLMQHFSISDITNWDPLTAQKHVRNILEYLENKNKSPNKPANF